MIRQDIAISLFKFAWGLLLFVAILAQLFFKSKILKKGGLIPNLLVVLPYLIIFGLFSAGNHFGRYQGNIFTQTLGILFILAGICGYILSILFLRSNWSVAAAVKEGHTLVKSGPYKLVRHPMYFFMILTALGSGLLISNYLMIAYTPVIIFIYYFRAKQEEILLKEALPGYRQYAQETKILIPWLI